MALGSDDKEIDRASDDSAASFFRREAVEYQRRGVPGTVLASGSLPRWVASGASLLFGTAICLFLAAGQYTRRERVTGQVQLTDKVAHVYASIDGTLADRFVKEGDVVVAGAPLFSIDSDKRSSAIGETQAAVVSELKTRIQDTGDERQRKMDILIEQRRSLEVRVKMLTAQVEQIGKESAVLRQRIIVNSDNLDRYRKLAADGYFPVSELQDKVQQNLDAEARLSSIQRDMFAVAVELEQAQSQLRNFERQAENDLTGYDERRADLKAQEAESEGRRQIVVYSKISGRVTAPLYDAGQSVNASTLLVSIIPSDTQYIVDLYVPSKATGFVSIGSQVLLRYEAFPYEKFGQYTGSVSEVSRTALSPTIFQAGRDSSEQLYRVRVKLDHQSIVAYGKAIPLEDGMKVDADILLETRKLYEWVLEPLFAITGRYGSAMR